MPMHAPQMGRPRRAGRACALRPAMEGAEARILSDTAARSPSNPRMGKEWYQRGAATGGTLTREIAEDLLYRGEE